MASSASFRYSGGSTEDRVLPDDNNRLKRWGRLVGNHLFIRCCRHRFLFCISGWKLEGARTAVLKTNIWGLGAPMVPAQYALDSTMINLEKGSASERTRGSTTISNMRTKLMTRGLRLGY
jgi:hypothetical protein